MVKSALEAVGNSSADDVLFMLGRETGAEHLDKAAERVPAEGAEPLTAQEKAIRDEVVKLVKGSGIEVVTDSQEAQAVIDRANDGLRAARRRSEEAENRNKFLHAIDWATAFMTGKTEKKAREERKRNEEKFKAETKELYQRVLSGNFDDVTLHLIEDFIKKVTPFNQYGRPLSKRLPAGALFKVSKGERAGSVDALFSRISESAVPANERTRPEAKRRIEEKKKELLKAWAIATGNWHTSVKDFTDSTEPLGSGKDSDVYKSKDGRYVIKVSKGKDGLKRFRPDMDKVALFNYVFPDSRYEILGYGEIDGKFVRFLRQPIVDFSESTPLSAEERVSYMKSLGFKPMNDEKTAFTNGVIVASDIQGNNIVRDKDGNIRVIDADMRLHTKDVGGDYTYPPVERDTETAPSIREHRVYHGSGNDFDHFDHRHMGEGEGAQAYGWGTYVTEVEGIGRTYAEGSDKSRAAKNSLEHQTAAIEDQIDRTREDLEWEKNNLKKAKEWEANAEIDLAEYRDKAEELKRKYGEQSVEYQNHLFNDIYTDEYARAKRAVESAKEGIEYRRARLGNLEKALDENQKELDRLSEEKSRHLYTVEIPDDTGSNYLDWDAPVEESVKEQMKKRILKEKHSDDEIENEMLENDVSDSLDEAVDGKALYKAISMYLGDKDASMALSSLGYTGIKYPADYRRGGNKEGKKNYVVFNEKDAKITDHVRFFRTPDGEAYGFTVGGKIYIDPRIAKADTPIHEYAHLWATALRAGNAKEWRNVVELMKGTPVWDEVRKLYPELSDDDAIADEVLAQYSGRRGAERLRQEMRTATEKAHGLVEKSMVVKAFDSVRTALDKFWRGVADFLHIHYTSAEEVADRVLRDLLNGVNPNDYISGNTEKNTDRAYLDAVERGDMETAQRMVNEAAEKAGYSSNSDYQGTSAFNGAAPYGNDFFQSKEERKKAWINDEWDGYSTLGDYIDNGVDGGNIEELTNRYSYRGADPMRKEAIENVRDVVENRKKTITMYRSVPSSVKEGSFRNGDWVTPSRKYAEDNAEVHGWGKNYRIIKQEVPVDDVWFDGNDIAEFGYGREEDFINDRDFAYKNTENNRKLLDAVTYDDSGRIILPSERFNETKPDVRYQKKKEDDRELEAVNRKFNEQIVTLTEANADKVALSLGRPSAVLRSAGVDDKPMKLYGNKVMKKMRKHGFTLDELRDLPNAVADPIAVFDNYGKEGNRSILTELRTKNGNFLVTIDLGKGNNDIDFNIVSSVFGKGEDNVVDWINRGLATYIDKEKALNYLHHSALRAVTSDNTRLSSAAKVVESFENPKADGENNSPIRFQKAVGGNGKAADNVKDWVDDTPSDARKRGFRMVNGTEVRRQDTLSEGDEIVYGKEHTTKFSQKDKPSTRFAVVDADKVQPSHTGGQRNPVFFIDEAQPKDRKDQVSRSREAEIASEINPEEITFGATAYQGAPTINERGEVIQGNNRAAALKEMFSGGYGVSVKRYKSFLRDNAKMFGLTPEHIDRMKKPMLVNVATVDDAEAIRLGQLKASDNESGGVQQIEPKPTVQKLTGAGKLQNFTDILLKSDNPDVSISELIQTNGVTALKYMRDMGIINDTQYNSAFNEKDALTEQARTDLRNIIKHTLFDGAPSEVETMFERMPAKAQRAILGTISRDYKSDEGSRIKGIIQQSISAFYNAETTSSDFSDAKNPKQAKVAMDNYKRQMQLLGDRTMLPEEYFGKFALLLAEAYKGLSQRSLQDMFNRLYDSLQGATSGTGDLFGGDAEVKKLSIEQAFKKVFGYEDTKLSGSNVLGDSTANGERRQSGSDRNDRGGGRGAAGERGTNRGAGAKGSTGEGEQDVAGTKPGKGAFGTIYEQFKGKAKEAVAWLMQKKEGEAVGALHHRDIGDIDLVWGKEGTGKSDGFGLAKLVKYHPEVVGNLQEILDSMEVKKRTKNRVQLESELHQASVRLTWDDTKKSWLLTAFEKKKEKKNSASNNSTDTVETADGGKRNDTATPQSTVPDSKDTEVSSEKQENSVPVGEPETEAGGGGASVPPTQPPTPPTPEEGAGETTGGELPEDASVDDIKARIAEVKKRRAEATKEYLSGQPHSEQARDEAAKLRGELNDLNAKLAEAV